MEDRQEELGTWLDGCDVRGQGGGQLHSRTLHGVPGSCPPTHQAVGDHHLEETHAKEQGAGSLTSTVSDPLPWTATLRPLAKCLRMLP